MADQPTPLTIDPAPTFDNFGELRAEGDGVLRLLAGTYDGFDAGVIRAADGGLVVAHAGMGCVWVFSELGEPLYRVRSPGGLMTTNVAFGGPGNRRLYITESHTGSILTADLPVAGRKLLPDG